MNKKLIVSVIALVMGIQAGGVVFAAPASLTDDIFVNEVIRSEENMAEEKGLYIEKTDVITRIDKTENGYSILVGDEFYGTVFHLSQDVLIIDADTASFVTAGDLKVGMKITVVLPKNAPMTMSLPGQTGAAEVIIIQGTKQSGTVGHFNEELVNESNTLALNISEDTVIMNNRGEKRVFVADDVKNKNAVVIYGVTTRSIPAQTNPALVLIMESEEESLATEIDKEVPEEVIVPAETNAEKAISKGEYIVLRQVAKEFGYEIKWENGTKTATLIKGDDQMTFTVGQKKYTHNGDEKVLDQIIKLENNVVCIPGDIEFK